MYLLLQGGGAPSAAGAGSTFDLTIKLVAMFGAAFAWFYQTRATHLRSKIKLDLEIYQLGRALLPADDANRAQANARRLMGYLYRQRDDPSGRSWPDLFLGAGLLIGALVWLAVSIARDFAPLWQFGVTLVLAFIGIGAVMNGMNPSGTPSSPSPQSGAGRGKAPPNPEGGAT